MQKSCQSLPGVYKYRLYMYSVQGIALACTARPGCLNAQCSTHHLPSTIHPDSQPPRHMAQQHTSQPRTSHKCCMAPGLTCGPPTPRPRASLSHKANNPPVEQPTSWQLAQLLALRCHPASLSFCLKSTTLCGTRDSLRDACLWASVPASVLRPAGS